MVEFSLSNQQDESDMPALSENDLRCLDCDTIMMVGRLCRYSLCRSLRPSV